MIEGVPFGAKKLPAGGESTVWTPIPKGEGGGGRTGPAIDVDGEVPRARARQLLSLGSGHVWARTAGGQRTRGRWGDTEDD